MLKIYDRKEDVPEELAEHYKKRSDGKYEPQIEGINSIGGLLTKRDELLEKVTEIPNLKTRITELEGQETLPAGSIAIPKEKAELLASYESLGSVDDIKPKIDGYDDLKAKDEARERTENYRTVAKRNGFTNEDGFIRLAEVEKIETVTKTVNENGKAIEKDFVKTKKDGKDVEMAVSDYVKESPVFKPFADSLTSVQGEGKKVIKQTANGGAPASTLEAEVKAQKQTGIYQL